MIEDGGHVETVVVGGSQAGLAVGYHLKQLGRPFVVLEAHGRVGDTWRSRWDSLRLFTTARYDGLPGMPFPARRSHYPTKDEVADYLESYAERFDLPVETGVGVDHVVRREKGFVVTAGGRTIRADNVVAATGAYHTPRVPDFAHELDAEIVQLHSTDYRNPAQLRPGDALVVGAANSGAEIAMDVVSGHRTWLSGRPVGQEPARAGSTADLLGQPVMWFLANHVMTVGTPIGRRVRDRFLDPPRGIPLGRIRNKDIVAAGVERVPRTVGVRDGRPLLEDGRVLDVANVLWCTGFVMDFSWIVVPLPFEHGLPTQDRGVVRSQPGLYLVGLPFLHSLGSVLLGGVGRDAAHIARHIASRASSEAAAARPSERTGSRAGARIVQDG
jgi:putative flavoprotein involved in K+ transport